MEIVVIALALIVLLIAYAALARTGYEPIKLHSDDCDICQEDMRRAE